MDTIRSFIAIELSTEIHAALEQISTSLARQTRIVKWIPASNIHLTIKFLGEVPQARLALLNKTLQSTLYSLKPLEFQVGNLSAFPTPRRPRVIWIGVQAPLELDSLQKNVEDAASRLGFPSEDRPFSPHLTLGRVNQHASPSEVLLLGEVLLRTSIGKLGSVVVKGITIFRSDLRPSGPIYTRLYEAKLAAFNGVK